MTSLVAFRATPAGRRAVGRARICPAGEDDHEAFLLGHAMPNG
jgi:hypothetical protein